MTYYQTLSEEHILLSVFFCVEFFFYDTSILKRPSFFYTVTYYTHTRNCIAHKLKYRKKNQRENTDNVLNFHFDNKSQFTLTLKLTRYRYTSWFY